MTKPLAGNKLHPLIFKPLPKVKVPANVRSVWPDATHKIHGDPLFKLLIPGPRFPADAETSTPFIIAPKEAMDIESSYKGMKRNPKEMDIISTPSATAWSILHSSN
ncbi:hypothetical protein RND71_007429 [Anisodus tanguticus]|uniref:Uncharacterized protein n=1 Tax=Anisodus tanguticus TaxID=243964 RepID=A0AAE1SLE4_9SOLA|nr:hypothetical protein RND71_007429 [Anisodus tanguticus]